jgi:hypothetical protein
MAKDKKEETVNDIFEDQPEIPVEEQLWGKNPKRTQLLRDIWYDAIVAQIDAEKEMPDDAKRELMFMMTVHSTLDIVLESLPDELSVELSYCLDNMLGLAAANKRYDVDLLEANFEVIKKVKRDSYKTDEEFEAAVVDQEEKWWTAGKQHLGGRSPNDAIAEELSRYGLNK